MAQNIAEERQRIFAEEALVVEAQGLLHEIMENKGFSRADLARAMGISRPRVTQIFSDDCKNLTVRLLARAFYALGEEPLIRVSATENFDALGSQVFARAASPDHSDRRESWVELNLPDENGEPVCANDNIFGSLAEIRRRRSSASFKVAA